MSNLKIYHDNDFWSKMMDRRFKTSVKEEIVYSAQSGKHLLSILWHHGGLKILFKAMLLLSNDHKENL